MLGRLQEAYIFLQKSVVYGMTSRPIFCSLGRGRSGPPTLYQLYGCCLEQYQGQRNRGVSSGEVFEQNSPSWPRVAVDDGPVEEVTQSCNNW